jgi:hypothetical protein
MTTRLPVFARCEMKREDALPHTLSVVPVDARRPPAKVMSREAFLRRLRATPVDVLLTRFGPSSGIWDAIDELLHDEVGGAGKGPARAAGGRRSETSAGAQGPDGEWRNAPVCSVRPISAWRRTPAAT